MNFDMRRNTYMKLMLAYVSVYIAYTQLKIDIFNFGPIRDSNLIPFLLGWKFFVHEFRYKTELIYEARVTFFYIKTHLRLISRRLKRVWTK